MFVAPHDSIVRGRAGFRQSAGSRPYPPRRGGRGFLAGHPATAPAVFAGQALRDRVARFQTAHGPTTSSSFPLLSFQECSFLPTEESPNVQLGNHYATF